ncbi:retrovirus-related pol polyprotein from transposon TNT 1-94 [Tanacetum coccineum]
MPPHLHKKFHMGVAIAKGCRGYYKPGTRAWVRRGSRKIRIPIDMYPCRVEERLTIKFVKREEELKIETTVTSKDGTVTKFPGKFLEYKPTKEEEEISKLKAIYENVIYDISDNPVCDEVGQSYDSDVLSEVQDHDHYQDAICDHHEEHEMHDDVQPNHVVDLPCQFYEHFEGIQKALTKEVKEMSDAFDELEAKLDQSIVDMKHDEIERKNLLIEHDNIIADGLSKEVFYVVSNSKLNVSRFTEMQKAHNVVKARCLELEAELSNLLDNVRKDNYNELLNRLSNLEVKPNVLAPGKYAIDVEPIPPRNRNNREVHLVYLRLSYESVGLASRNRVNRCTDASRSQLGAYSRKIGSPPAKSDTLEERMSAIACANQLEPNQHWDSNVQTLIFAGFQLQELEVASESTSLCLDTDGVELLKGSRGSNLYTISIEDMMKSSLICLLSKASKHKSWLWHRRLNHLNFGTINDLARKDLVRGLPRLKFEKDHLCSACQLGKSKKHTHKPKTKNTNLEVLNTLHMDLCRPMRVYNLLMKKYSSVICR